MASGYGSLACMLAALPVPLRYGAPFEGTDVRRQDVRLSGGPNVGAEELEWCTVAPAWHRRDAGQYDRVAFCVWSDYSFLMRVGAISHPRFCQDSKPTRELLPGRLAVTAMLVMLKSRRAFKAHIFIFTVNSTHDEKQKIVNSGPEFSRTEVEVAV